jgi:hypothetical protein
MEAALRFQSTHLERLVEIGKVDPSAVRGNKRAVKTSRRVRGLKHAQPHKTVRTSASDINRNSNSKYYKRQCKCKDKNCWAGVYPSTTRMYRERLYDPDPVLGRYHLRKELYKEVDSVLKEGIRRGWYKRTPVVKQLKYFIRCAQEPGVIRMVCPQVFCAVAGVCSDTLGHARKAVLEGNPPDYSRSKEKALYQREKSPAWLAISTYLEGLSHHLANLSPDIRNTELPMGSKLNYYEMFVEDWKAGISNGLYFRKKVDPLNPENDPEPPSCSLFYKIWAIDFGSLVVPRRQNRFSKCDICINYKAQLDEARRNRDFLQAEEWKTRLYAHYRWVTLQRKKYYWHRRKAADQPNV